MPMTSYIPFQLQRHWASQHPMLLRSHFVPLLVALTGAFVSPLAWATDSPLLGRWSFTEGGCADTYLFRGDGSFISTSGEERRTGSFAVEVLSGNPKAPYKVVRNSLHDNTGKDCVGSSADDSGTQDVRYVFFNASKNQMMVCSSPGAERCFGPLIRAK